VYYRSKIQAPFFAFYLKDKGSIDQKEATVFESGSNTWKTYSAWPPKEAVTQSLYFGANGTLNFTPPSKNVHPAANDSYVSDPAHPVPYRKRPIEPTYFPKGSGWGPWLTEDQRFVTDRPDVLVYQTEVLTEDLTIAGDISAKLFISTTQQDADFVVKLIDVYPEEMPDPKMGGYQFMIANDVFRARYRESFEHPKPLMPNAITPLTIDLHTQSYKFQKGHRVMVQVQSSWFPLIDRNPQKWVPNIYKARDSDFVAATHRVYRSAFSPSRVEISVIK
jgi:putative CocE/NonD family hydrolase